MSTSSVTLSHVVPPSTQIEPSNHTPVAGTAGGIQNVLLQQPVGHPVKSLDSTTITHINTIDLAKYRNLPAQFNRLERWLWIVPIIGWIALLIIHLSRKNDRLIANDLVTKGITNIYQAVQIVDSTLQWRYIYERGRQNLLAGKYQIALNDFKSIEIEDELCEDYNFPPDFLYLKANAARHSGNLWDAYDSYQQGIANAQGNTDFSVLKAQMELEFATIDHVGILLAHCRKMIEEKTNITNFQYGLADSPVIKEWTPEFNKYLHELLKVSQSTTIERKIEIAKLLFSLDLQKSWCFTQAIQLLNSILGITTVEQKVAVAKLIPREEERFSWLLSAYVDSTAGTYLKGQVAFELGKWYLEKWFGSAYNRFSSIKFTDADAKEMVRLLEEALQLGVEDARTELSAIYAQGKGVPEDRAKEYYWFHIHGKQHSAYELCQLANMHVSNYKIHVKDKSNKDELKTALHWYQAAADLAQKKNDAAHLALAKEEIAEVTSLL